MPLLSLNAAKASQEGAPKQTKRTLLEHWKMRRQKAKNQLSKDSINASVDSNTMTDTTSDVDGTQSTFDSISSRISETSSVNTHDEESEVEIEDDSSTENFRKFTREFLDGTSKSQKMKFLATKNRLDETLHLDYTEVLLDQANSGQYGIQAHLVAANHLFQEFLSILNLVKSCPMASTTEEFVYVTLEEYIRPRIADHYSTCMDEVLPGDAAKIVSWFEEFLTTLESACPKLEPSSKWHRDRDLLLEIYINRGVCREMRELLERSDGLLEDKDIRKDNNNNLVTGNPEEIAFIVRSQLSTAQDLLPPKYTERVLAACNEELTNLISIRMMFIGSHWMEISSRRYCAMVNDIVRFVEQCEQRNDQYLNSPEYIEAGDALCRELMEESLYVNTFLCEKIMGSLREPRPILTTIGDESWETGEGNGSALGSTIATLEDYFYDLEKWLASNYYYSKVLKNCFDMTLETYIASFFANTMARGVQNAKQASYKLNEDYLRLVAFFNGPNFDRHHGFSGFDAQDGVNSRLHIIQCLSRVLNPLLCPDALVDDIKTIAAQVNPCGDSAVLHLAGLRRRYTSKETIEWLRVIAIAKRESVKYTGTCQATNDTPSYKIPDPRNSKYINNLTRNTSTKIERSRMISKSVVLSAKEANNILRRNWRQKTRKKVANVFHNA